MAPASLERIEEFVDCLMEEGNLVAIQNRMGVALATIDRYIRKAKELGLLHESTRVVGSEVYLGQTPIRTNPKTPPEGKIGSLIEAQKARRGYSDIVLPGFRKVPGTHVTLDIGDLHCTDEDFLYESFFSALSNAVSKISQIPDIGWMTVRGLGDWITGKGIFKGQEARNVTNHAHWQTLLGGYLFFLVKNAIDEVLPCGVDVEMEYVKGNHDQVDGGSVNLAYYLCNEAYASFCTRVMYAGTETVANYGTDDDPVWALCVHGFGSGDYSPHSNSLLRRLSKRVSNLNMEGDKRITEIRHGHCFDEETEVLTPLGWARHSSLSIGSPVMTYNRDLGITEFQDVQQVFRYAPGECEDSQELIHVKAKYGLDLAVTPGHGLWVKTSCSEGAAWRNSTAEEEYGKYRQFRLAAPFAGEGAPISDERLRVIAWIMAEGNVSTYRKDGTPGDTRIVQANAPDGRLGALERALSDAGLEYTKGLKCEKGSLTPTMPNGKQYARNYDCYWLLIKDAANHWRGWIGDYLDPKRFPRGGLWWLNGEQSKVFLEAYIVADGTKSDGHGGKWESRSSQIGTKYRRIADLLQAMALKAGMRSSLISRPGGMFCLTINERDEVSVGPRNWSRAPNDGLVWCVSVPNGALAVRRRGKTAITLNTHWVQSRGMLYTRSLTVYSTGGFQRNKRPELGQSQRPTGFALTVATPDGEYCCREVMPDDAVLIREVSSKDLEFKNLERIGKMLGDALEVREIITNPKAGCP